MEEAFEGDIISQLKTMNPNDLHAFLANFDLEDR
jgi:hypothetical protein